MNKCSFICLLTDTATQLMPFPLKERPFSLLCRQHWKQWKGNLALWSFVGPTPSARNAFSWVIIIAVQKNSQSNGNFWVVSVLFSYRWSHLPVWCRDLGSLPESYQATWVVSPALLALHPWHQMARLVLNKEVLKRASLPKLNGQPVDLASVATALGWPHLKDGRHTHAQKAVFSELQEEKRDCDAPRKRYKDQLKRQLAQTGSGHQSLQQKPSDRELALISEKGHLFKFKAERHEATKERRGRQREQAAFQLYSALTFPWPNCSRVCASKIRLYSHQRACKNWPSTFPKSSTGENQPSSKLFTPNRFSLNICRVENEDFFQEIVEN